MGAEFLGVELVGAELVAAVGCCVGASVPGLLTELLSTVPAVVCQGIETCRGIWAPSGRALAAPRSLPGKDRAHGSGQPVVVEWRGRAGSQGIETCRVTWAKRQAP